MQRGDDTADKLKNRLKVFHKETQPVINHYAKSGKVAHIDASQDMEAVSQAIRNQL
jgi:adenylate kinase